MNEIIEISQQLVNQSLPGVVAANPRNFRQQVFQL